MTLLSDLPNSLTSLLFQTLIQLKREIIHAAEQHELTVTQTHTLLLLFPASPVPMRALSVALDCDASNITGIIDRLENHQLIARQDNPRDRRVKMIVLTAKGEALRERLFNDIFTAGDQQLKRVLNSAECQTLQSLLNKIQGHLLCGPHKSGRSHGS